MKNQLIAFSPLIAIILGASIFMGMSFGWIAGIVLPIIFLLSWGIAGWIGYWEEKAE